MSISTYSELQSAVQGWLGRGDLAGVTDDFITLAEADFNRKLRTRQMMVTQVTTPSSGLFALPTDYLTWVKVTWDGSVKRELQYVHPSQLGETYPSTPSDVPRYFSVLGTTDNVGEVQIIPRSAEAINFTYYQKITALSTSSTSNWLLSAHPDLYLAGALAEGFAYIQEYDKSMGWKARRDELVADVKSLDQKTRGPSAIMVPGNNP